MDRSKYPIGYSEEVRSSPRAFFDAVSRAPSERAVAVALMDLGGALTGAFAVGFSSMGSKAGAEEIHTRGVSDSVIDGYEASGRSADPLLRWVSEHHAACEADVETLQRTSPPDYRHFLGEFEAKHAGTQRYMLAPIVVGNGLVGMMHFASFAGPRFDLRVGGAITLHVSTRIAVLRALDSFSAAWDGVLTRREREVGELAARGLSTGDLARVVGVSPNTVKKHLKALYRRTGVSSRTELSALLLRGPASLDVPRLTLPQPQLIHGGTRLYPH